MRAAVYREYGEASEVLLLGETDRPVPGADWLMVQVEAAGVDRARQMVTGLPTAGRLLFGLRWPRNPVPGLELAAVATAPGSCARGGDGAGRYSGADGRSPANTSSASTIRYA